MTVTNQNNYNLSAINMSVNGNSDPNKYFNNYFGPSFQVSPNVDAAILSYFEQVSDNKVTARVLASAVIYTSYTQQINPMQALAEFTQLPKGELNAYLTMFLNLQRVGTSFLGITNRPVANKYVSRAVLP